jgi:hypothetical protein
MRYLVLAVFLLASVAAAFGQNRGTYSSLGGYGNVLYPGTGHAPATPPGGINGPNFGGRGPAPVAGRNVFPNPFPANHPQHGRTVIVPYPVYYGGYSGYQGNDAAPAYQDPGAAAAYSNAPPSVVINQNFVPQQVTPVLREYPDPAADQPSGMRMYEAPIIAPRRAAPSDDRPTVYLIAFRDHSIVQALGYWMEGATLHYVSVEHTLNQVSMDLVDRDLSQRLNDERGLDFKFPR